MEVPSESFQSPPLERDRRLPDDEEEEEEELLDEIEDNDIPIEGDFTIRAVIVGLLVGVLLAFTNLYFGLQTGWISMMSLQSALLGFAIFRLLTSLPQNRFTHFLSLSRPFTPQENVVLQTTAVATGTLPLAAGLVGIIPALEMVNMKEDGVMGVKLGYWGLVGWSLGICFFGVFLAAPLRKQVIVREKLVFPSGTATAQLIALLHKIPPPRLPRPTSQGAPPSSEEGYVPVPDRSSMSPTRSASQDRIAEPTAGGSRAPKAKVARKPRREEREEMGSGGWWILGWSFAASAGLTFTSFLFPVVFAIPVFDVVGAVIGVAFAADWLWWFTPSLSYVGQGIIMGFPTTVSMNLGMITGWALLSPLAKHSGWAPGPVSSSTDGSRGWILWVALSIMISESIISLLPICVSYFLKLRSQRNQRSRTDLFRSTTRDSHPGADYFDDLLQTKFGTYDSYDEDEPELEPPERLVPMNWVYVGLGGSAVLGIVMVWLIFGNEGIKPWATAIGLVLACVLSVLGVRALGETDLNPVSGIGKISQLLFAVLQPGNVVANIIAGGVAEAGAQQAGDLMQDLKTGALLKASPRSQFYGQMIGSLASVFVSTGAYKLYTSVYQIPGPEFRVPTAAIWLNLARLLNRGHLPPYAQVFMIIFGSIFALLSILKYMTPVFAKSPPAFIKYIPSGIAFSIGFLNTPSFSLARLIGGYIAFRTRKNGETPLMVIVCASGFVLGEGIISIVGLVMTGAGRGALSCIGCNVGGGGYCSGGC